MKILGMAFNLDISKAYDNVRWDFLYDVLERVGFNEKVLNLMRMMVSTIQYGILLNGSPWGNFEAGRGLRQGDPLSPDLLFACGCTYVSFLHYVLPAFVWKVKVFVHDFFAIICIDKTWPI